MFSTQPSMVTWKLIFMYRNVTAKNSCKHQTSSRQDSSCSVNFWTGDFDNGFFNGMRPSNSRR